MNTKIWKAILALPTLCGLILLAGCGKKESTEEQPAAAPGAAAPAATPIDPATAATVTGTVKFDGAAPKPAMIDMSQDPTCKRMNLPENETPSDVPLAHLFAHLKQ